MNRKRGEDEYTILFTDTRKENVKRKGWKVEKISIIIERTKLYGLDSEGTRIIDEGRENKCRIDMKIIRVQLSHTHTRVMQRAK